MNPQLTCVAPNKAEPVRKKVTLSFALFCCWVYVILGRPQDLLPFLVPLRPSLMMAIFSTLVFFLQRTGKLTAKSAKNTQFRLYLALFLVMVVSVPTAYYRRGAFEFVFLNYISIVLFFFIFVLEVDSINKIKSVLLISCISALIYSLYALIGGNFQGNRLAFGEMYDPNDLAFFLVTMFPLNFLFLSRENAFYAKLVCIASLLLSALVILMTGSRGGIISLCVVTCLALFTSTRTIKTSYKIVFILVFGLILLFNISKLNLERYATILNLQSDYNLTSDGGRIDIWSAGVRIMFSHPITGVGVRCFSNALGYDRRVRGELPRWQTAHNAFLQIGAETGVIGLFLFALITFRALRVFSRCRQCAESMDFVKIGEISRIGFIGLVVGAMFLSQAYSPLWAFYIALSAVLSRFLEDEKNKKQPLLSGYSQN